jgi:NAD(P)-dependent dehydrogenase (short-subunit alcohol dehydrogenase family)
VTTNVRVNLINPGPTRTRMRAAAMPGEDPMSVKPVEPVAQKIVEMCLPDFQETGKLYDCEKGRLLTMQSPV